jgi:hypothetical protein
VYHQLGSVVWAGSLWRSRLAVPGLTCLGLGKEVLRAVATGAHAGMSRHVDGGWPCGGGNVAALGVRAQGEVTMRSAEAAAVARARDKVPGWWHFGSRGKSTACAVEALELGSVSCDAVVAEVGREAHLAAMRWLRAPGGIGGGERSKFGARATEDRRRYSIYPEECLLPLDDTSTRMMIFRATWPYSQAGNRFRIHI